MPPAHPYKSYVPKSTDKERLMRPERILDEHLSKDLKEKKDLLAHNEMLFISGTNILKRGKEYRNLQKVGGTCEQHKKQARSVQG